MRIRRKTAVVVQTHQLTTVHLKHPPIRSWCGACGAEVLMLTPDEAAALVESTAREVFRRVEEGEVHFIEPNTRELLICSVSLRGVHESTVSPTDKQIK